MAWRNPGFTRANSKTKISNVDKERDKQNIHKFGQKDQELLEIITEIFMHK